MAQDVIEVAPSVVHVANVDVPQLDVREAQAIDERWPMRARSG